jgi:hypothetical protein
MFIKPGLLTGATSHAFLMPRDHYSWISSFKSLTSSPGLKAGNPMYGQPSHLKASPKAPIRSQFYFTDLKKKQYLQLPQLPTLPFTVKSTSAKSSAWSLSVLSAWSALARLALSSASSFWAKPHVQSLQARRRLALGLHSVAVEEISTDSAQM